MRFIGELLGDTQDAPARGFADSGAAVQSPVDGADRYTGHVRYLVNACPLHSVTTSRSASIRRQIPENRRTFR
jgi:hypothetical protein